MAEERLALAELLEKAGDGDFLRSVAEAVLQLLMEADVDGLIRPAATSEAASAPPGATAFATAASIPGSANCSCGSPSYVKGATFRRSSKPARAQRRRWWR